MVQLKYIYIFTILNRMVWSADHCLGLVSFSLLDLQKKRSRPTKLIFYHLKNEKEYIYIYIYIYIKTSLRMHPTDTPFPYSI